MKIPKKTLDTIISLFLGLTAFALGTFLIFIMKNTFEPKNETKEQLARIENNIQEIKKVVVPYDHKNSLSKVVIIENFKNSTYDTKPTETFSKKIIRTGKINQGYLYIKASVNQKPIGANGDIYIKMTARYGNEYHESGGHLIESKSLDTPKQESFTELLFDLANVRYKERFKDSDVDFISADWLELLNRGSNQEIIGFSSTVENGDIPELSIYYECERDSQCSIFAK